MALIPSDLSFENNNSKFSSTNMYNVCIDPTDFFPTYDLCQSRRGRRTRSNCRCTGILTHLLAVLFGVALCIGILYYYAIYYPDDSFAPTNKSNDDQLAGYNDQINEIIQMLKGLNKKVENTENWRKHIDEIFTQSYIKESNLVDKKIADALDAYDADKVGVFDFAAEYAGGAVISFPETCPYPTNRTICFFRLLAFSVTSNPDNIIRPNTLPGSCFAFYGSKGNVVIKLARPINIRSVTLEHSSLSFNEDPSSAPKDFEVYGFNSIMEEDEGTFLGNFTFRIDKRYLQMFNVNLKNDIEFSYVRLRILNNHGKKEFTCVYRFRVHNVKSRLEVN